MYPFISVLRNVQKSKGRQHQEKDKLISDSDQEKDKLISDADKNSFLKMVNGLINNGRGFICLQFDDILLKDNFHGKVDTSLRLLLPDGWHYSAVFEQHFVDNYHLHVGLKNMALMNKGEQCTRPLSTKEFYLKYPTESGLYLPTYQEVTWLIKHIAGNALSQQTNKEAVRSTRYRFVLNEQVLSDDDKKRPILESVNVQLKHSPTFKSGKVKKIADNIESSLHIAQYISTFASIPGGGSIFLGIEEKAKKGHPDLKEPICQGIRLSKEECEDLGKRLGRKIRSSLMWATIQAVNDQNPTQKLTAQTPEKFPITFLFRRVRETSGETSKDLFVLEVRVEFFNGLVFHNGTGPRAYKYEGQQLTEIEFEKWAKEHQCTTVSKDGRVYTCTLKKHNWVSEKIESIFPDEQPRMEEGAVDEQPRMEESAVDEHPRMEEGAVDEQPRMEASAVDEQPRMEASAVDEQPRLEEDAVDEQHMGE